MDLTILKSELVRDEGLRFKPYRDSVGKLTIGVGHNLDDVPISYAAAMQILEDDILQAMGQLNGRIPWWVSLNETRQRALMNLCFQLGINGLMGFKQMLAALQDSDWQRAHDELINSKLNSQAPNRTGRTAQMLLTGLS